MGSVSGLRLSFGSGFVIRELLSLLTKKLVRFVENLSTDIDARVGLDSLHESVHRPLYDVISQ
jgi:hypothetical protein